MEKQPPISTPLHATSAAARTLTVGAVNDPLEHEADAMADRVMRMPETPFVQLKCAACDVEENQVQRKPLAAEISPFIQAKGGDGSGIASEAVSSGIRSSRGNGSRLPDTTRTFMESRFGADFSGVNIHTGNEAVQMSRELHAQAFTVGSDIYFNAGRYSPESSDGKRLLAHELTHTLQQGNAIQPKRIQRAGFGDVKIFESELEAQSVNVTTCPVQSTGTLSKVSWGETSGLYPTKNNLYSPDKWDGPKTCELLKLRSAVHEVAKRGEKVHEASPGSGNIEQLLKPYHLVENFPGVDSEIADDKVKWFYLSHLESLTEHPTMSTLTSVKTYGSFYNIGGGDVKKGDVYVHFYKKKT